MAALITRVRGLIADPSSTYFADQDVQDMLDRYRYVARFAPLRPEPFFRPGGIVNFLDYFADFGDWEEGYQLFDNRFGIIEGAPTTDGVTVTPANGTLYSADTLTGHWVFVVNTTAQTTDNYTNPMPFGQIPVVRVNGYTYDVFMSAAMLLEQMAAKFMLEFNFTTNQQMFARNQQFANIMVMKEQYLMKARPQFAFSMREDQTDASYLPTNQWVGTGYYQT